MRVLIAGGRGFLGTALRHLLISRGHRVQVLTRSAAKGEEFVQWDGKSSGPWERVLSETDAVVNACGLGLEHWPWTAARKQQFIDSRLQPGMALTRAIATASPRPRVLVQFSGINRYGLHGAGLADEQTPVAGDFLAQLTVPWEASTRPVEELGVRRVIARNAVVLDSRNGLFPLMCLPSRLWLGGRIGNGDNALPWIHISDHARALLFLLESDASAGPFNLVAPAVSTSAAFMKEVCRGLHRPYWLHVSGRLIRLGLGEMADLILRGRASSPRRLLEAGYEFELPDITAAMRDLVRR